MSTITVGQLIEQLQQLDPDLVVVKQKDDEGNGYHKLFCVDDDAYVESLDDYNLEVINMEYIQCEADEYNEGVVDMSQYTRVCVIV